METPSLINDDQATRRAAKPAKDPLYWVTRRVATAALQALAGESDPRSMDCRCYIGQLYAGLGEAARYARSYESEVDIARKYVEGIVKIYGGLVPPEGMPVRYELYDILEVVGASLSKGGDWGAFLEFVDFAALARAIDAIRGPKAYRRTYAPDLARALSESSAGCKKVALLARILEPALSPCLKCASC